MKNVLPGKWRLRYILLYFSRRLGFKYGRLIYYVTNNKALPPPLSPQEEADLLERLKTG